MTQALIIALITAIFSTISAILSSLITKNGIAFWRSARVIKCKGTGRELQVIKPNGSIVPISREYKYDISDVAIMIKGTRVSVTGLITTIIEPRLVSDGKLSGFGKIVNGVSYIVYTIEDAQRNQFWSGLLFLRISGLGDITGYWITEDQVDSGSIAFGDTTLKRS